MSAPLVQYILIRSDLKWTTGALIAQACHACCASLHRFKDDPNTKRYVEDVERMHKVVLEARDEDSLRQVSDALRRDNMEHHVWIEMPENVPTCLATKPYTKEDLKQYFKAFKLFK